MLFLYISINLTPLILMIFIWIIFILTIIVIVLDNLNSKEKIKFKIESEKQFLQFFIRELKNENAYFKFKKNFTKQESIERRLQYKYPITFEQFVIKQYKQYSTNENRFYYCFDDAFVWSNTKEGFHFWKLVTKKITDKYNEN